MHYTNKIVKQSPSAEANTRLGGQGFLYFLFIKYLRGLYSKHSKYKSHIFPYIYILILSFHFRLCLAIAFYLRLCLQGRAKKLLIIQLIKNFFLFNEAIILINISYRNV
jgi:hypothetical protein